MTEPPASDLASPCINVCKLDAKQICTGCGRSIDEIVEWPQAAPARKRQIIGLAAERRRAASIIAPSTEEPNE